MTIELLILWIFNFFFPSALFGLQFCKIYLRYLTRRLHFRGTVRSSVVIMTFKFTDFDVKLFLLFKLRNNCWRKEIFSSTDTRPQTGGVLYQRYSFILIFYKVTSLVTTPLSVNAVRTNVIFTTFDYVKGNIAWSRLTVLLAEGEHFNIARKVQDPLLIRTTVIKNRYAIFCFGFSSW